VVFSLCKRNVFLEKLNIRVDLDLNQIGRFNAFFNTSEVNPFRVSFRHNQLDQGFVLPPATPNSGRRRQDFTGCATSEGRKNGTKTAGCQIDAHRFAASFVFCRRVPG